ncbi:MAG: nucleotidyltransferase family protein [Patescibacteria group bacterium]
MTIEEIKQRILPILASNNVVFAGVFGSVARGQAKAESDIDLLVRFKQVPGMFAYIGLERQLSEVLGKKVDLATEESLHRLIKPTVLKELMTIYEE